jgi:hypothetical protein
MNGHIDVDQSSVNAQAAAAGTICQQACCLPDSVAVGHLLHTQITFGLLMLHASLCCWHGVCSWVLQQTKTSILALLLANWTDNQEIPDVHFTYLPGMWCGTNDEPLWL